MAIKILRKGLPVLGKVKIGGLNYEKPFKGKSDGLTHYPPMKWDHFKIFTTEKDQKGAPVLDGGIMEQLGEKPTELDIVLPFDDPELCFRTELGYYRGGTRYCFGDGEKAFRLEVRGKNGNLPIYGERKPHLPCGETCEDLVSRRCKPSGTLSFLLKQQPFVGGVYVFRTHGWRSVANIQESINAILMVTRGLLAWIPLKLSVQMEMVQPKDGGAAQLAPIVKLFFPGSPIELLGERKKLLEIQGPLQAEIKRLEAGLVNQPAPEPTAEEAAEIEEEFYPENAVAPTAAPGNGDGGFLDTAGGEAPPEPEPPPAKSAETRKESTRRAAQRSAEPKVAPAQDEPPPLDDGDLF